MTFRLLNIASLATTLLLATATTFVSGQEEITPEVFRAGILDGSYDLVLDVRRQDEWDAGHIPTAVHVPNETFETDAFWDLFYQAGTTTNSDSDYSYSCQKSCANIVVYCKSGRRSGEAIEKLRAMGFEGTLWNGMGVVQWTEDGGFDLATASDSMGQPVCATNDICPIADAVDTAAADAAAASDGASNGAASLATTSLMLLAGLVISAAV